MSTDHVSPALGVDRSGAIRAALAELAGRRRVWAARPIADEPLSRHTTFRIGGPADLYVLADRPALLEALVEQAAARGGAVDGPGRRQQYPGQRRRGARPGDRQRLSRDAARRAAGRCSREGRDPTGRRRFRSSPGRPGPLDHPARPVGLEWAVSVPGTVGGAVIGNAGAHGGDIAANLAWARVLYPGRGSIAGRRQSCSSPTATAC